MVLPATHNTSPSSIAFLGTDEGRADTNIEVEPSGKGGVRGSEGLGNESTHTLTTFSRGTRPGMKETNIPAIYSFVLRLYTF